MVLDEPTAGLDRRLSGMMLDAVSERNRQGATMVMISHDMRVVRERCTMLITLDDGRLRACGRLALAADDPWHPAGLTGRRIDGR